MNNMKLVNHNDIYQKESLKKNAALNMIKTLMSLVFPLITFPYSNRVLGPMYIGKVNFAQSVVMYFSLVAALGINTYAIRESAKLRANKETLSAFVKEVFSINMISTIIAYILFASALFVVPALGSYRILLCICSVSILFTTLGMDYLYIGLEEFTYITVRSIVFQFISLVLLLVFVKAKEDYLKYAGISVVSSVGSNICNFVHAKCFIDFKTKTKNIRIHMKPIFTLFAMSATVSIYTVLDITMLGFLKGDEVVGFYTAATKINHVVIMIITAATAVLLPRLSYYADKDKDKFFLIVNKATQFVFLFSVPCAIGLFILSEPIILVFSGKDFIPAVLLMRIMSVAIVFISLGCLMGGNVLVSAGMERSSLISTCIGASSNFILNILLIPRYGAIGASVGTVCAEFFVTATQFILGRKLIKWKFFFRESIKCMVASTIMIVVLLLIIQNTGNITLQFLLCMIFGATIYVGILILQKNVLIFEFLKIAKEKIG